MDSKYFKVKNRKLPEYLKNLFYNTRNFPSYTRQYGELNLIYRVTTWENIDLINNIKNYINFLFNCYCIVLIFLLPKSLFSTQ